MLINKILKKAYQLSFQSNQIILMNSNLFPTKSNLIKTNFIQNSSRPYRWRLESGAELLGHLLSSASVSFSAKGGKDVFMHPFFFFAVNKSRYRTLTPVNT